MANTTLSEAQKTLIRQMREKKSGIVKDLTSGWFIFSNSHGFVNTATANSLIKKGVLHSLNDQYFTFTELGNSIIL